MMLFALPARIPLGYVVVELLVFTAVLVAVFWRKKKR